MPSHKHSTPLRRDPVRPSVKDRAAALKASAARTIGPKTNAAADAAVEVGTKDPALAAIQRHRTAYASWLPHSEAMLDMLYGPTFLAAEKASAASRDAEAEAFADLLKTFPTTLAGLQAYVEYIPQALRQNWSEQDEDCMQAFDSIRDGLRIGVESGRIMPDQSPLPEHACPDPSIPTDLGEACIWAVRHGDWFNSGAGREGWSGERSRAEWERSAGVRDRAAREPGRDLRTIAAKATMLRQDILEDLGGDEEAGDGDARLTLRIMRDVIAFASERPDDDSLTLARAIKVYFGSEPDPAMSADIRLWDLAERIIARAEDQPERKVYIPALFDLGGFSISQLWAVYQTARCAEECLAGGSQMPRAWNVTDRGKAYNPAGTLLQNESSRLMDLMSAVAAEARHRPDTGPDAGMRLQLLISREMDNGDGLPPALTTEAAERWGDAAKD